MSDTEQVPARPSLPIGKRGELATAIGAAVDSVPGARRTAGSGTEVATQYAGGRVLGVQLDESEVSVHIVAELLPLQPVTDGVRAAVHAVMARAGDPRSVFVAVDDLDVDRLPRGVR